jgi:hypothetical protein
MRTVSLAEETRSAAGGTQPLELEAQAQEPVALRCDNMLAAPGQGAGSSRGLAASAQAGRGIPLTRAPSRRGHVGAARALPPRHTTRLGVELRFCPGARNAAQADARPALGFAASRALASAPGPFPGMLCTYTQASGDGRLEHMPATVVAVRSANRVDLDVRDGARTLRYYWVAPAGVYPGPNTWSSLMVRTLSAPAVCDGRCKLSSGGTPRCPVGCVRLSPFGPAAPHSLLALPDGGSAEPVEGREWDQ